MKEQAVLVPVRWNLRKAELVDVPAVARLIEPPPASRAGVPDTAVISAVRLVLAHVGLESGEFWVATDEQDVVRAATVLLPPRQDASGQETSQEEGVQAALRLHLGLTPAGLPDLAELTELTDLIGVPEAHWLLLALSEPGSEAVLEQLLVEALPAVDGAGLPVLNVHPGRATAALLGAGFALVAPAADRIEQSGLTGLTGLTVLLRPAARTVLPMPVLVADLRAPAMA